MPTITTLVWVLVVYGSMLVGLRWLVRTLAHVVSRHEQSLTLDLDALRLIRLKISITTPIRSRTACRLPTPGEEQHSAHPSEKSSSGCR